MDVYSIAIRKYLFRPASAGFFYILIFDDIIVTMLTSEELMDQWSNDCKIDRTKLLERMSQHPLLHSKYLTYLQAYKVKLRSLSLKYQKKRQFRTRYYNGELCLQELQEAKLEQYLFKKPLKSEMESLLDADADLQLIQEQILYIETLVTACESILKDLGHQYFLYKNIVDYTKFEAGI